MSEGCQTKRNTKECHVAAHGWSKRIIRSNPRVDIDWEMIGRDQTAQDCIKEALHTDCQGGNMWLPLLIISINRGVRLEF